MALVDKPIEFMLSVIAMCVWHTASILAVVASILSGLCHWGHEPSGTGCVFPSLHLWGKLYLLASPQIHSMSSSGVLLALILISSSWYILHH